MQRLRADRQGEVVPPRGTPTSGQQGVLPGMTQVARPTPRPHPVQLPPITSLLGTGAIEPVAQDGGDAGSTETTLPVDTSVATETPVGETPATNEQGQEPRTGPTPTTTPADEQPVAVETAVAVDQAGQETTPPTEQVTMPVDVEPPPIVQELDQTIADTQPPVDQPQPESTAPEEPVVQAPTPVVTRPRRKRRGSTTSAPGDLNPESGSDTGTGEIYHSDCHDHGLISQWFVARPSKRTRPSPARMSGYRNWMDEAERRTQSRVDIEASKYYLANRDAPLRQDLELSEHEQGLWARGRQLFIDDGFAALDRERGRFVFLGLGRTVE